MAHDESLADLLNELGATSDTIQQGLRYYLGERVDDLPSPTMEQEMLAAVADANGLRLELDALAGSDRHLEEAALVILTAAWGDPGQRLAIRASLEDAQRKLPVIETAIMAIVAMYGMYLLATGGKATSRKTRRSNDGSFTNEETQYASPSDWVRGIVGLFGGTIPAQESLPPPTPLGDAQRGC